MAKQKLSSEEITKHIIGLKPGDSFTVKTKTERGVASSAAKTLRDGGIINFIVASRESNGHFVFFIVPA